MRDDAMDPTPASVGLLVPGEVELIHARRSRPEQAVLVIVEVFRNGVADTSRWEGVSATHASPVLSTIVVSANSGTGKATSTCNVPSVQWNPCTSPAGM